MLQLYCPKCQKTVPVLKMKVIGPVTKDEYRNYYCAYCRTPLESKIVKKENSLDET